MSTTTPAAASGRSRFTGQLLTHQQAGVDFLHAHPRCLLADDVGLGKTIQAIYLIALLLAEDPWAKVLVLTDLSLVGQWLAEVARFLPGVPAKALGDVSALDGGYPSVTVANYDRVDSYAGGLDRQGFALVVLDEATALKGAGKRHRIVRELTTRVPRVVGLTATALETSPEETYALLTAVGAPGLMTPSQFNGLLRFTPSYLVPGTRRRIPGRCEGFAPGGAQEFRAYLDTVTLRRTAIEVGMDLPLRVGPGLVWVPLPIDQQTAYEAAESITDPLARFQARERASRFTPDGGSALVDAAIDRFDTTPAEKTIIYAYNLAALDLVETDLDTRGIGHARIDGRLTDRDRERALTAFEDDPDCLVLLGTSTLERGLNLQHARRLWSLDSTWNPAAEAQREGRIRRYRSPHPTTEHVTFLPDVPLVREKWNRLAQRTRTANEVGL